MPYNPIASDDAGGAGGTCVLRGCVPKKLFVYAAEYREMFHDAQGFGCARALGKPPGAWLGVAASAGARAARRRRVQRARGPPNHPCRPAVPPRRWQMAGQPTLDWQAFLAKKNAELQRLNGVYMNLLNNSGVDVSEPAPCCAGACCAGAGAADGGWRRGGPQPRRRARAARLTRRALPAPSCAAHSHQRSTLRDAGAWWTRTRWTWAGGA